MPEADVEGLTIAFVQNNFILRLIYIYQLNLSFLERVYNYRDDVFVSCLIHMIRMFDKRFTDDVKQDIGYPEAKAKCLWHTKIG